MKRELSSCISRMGGVETQKAHASNMHTCGNGHDLHGNVWETTEGQKMGKQVSPPKGSEHRWSKSKTMCMQISFC